MKRILFRNAFIVAFFILAGSINESIILLGFFLSDTLMHVKIGKNILRTVQRVRKKQGSISNFKFCRPCTILKEFITLISLFLASDVSKVA